MEKGNQYMGDEDDGEINWNAPGNPVITVGGGPAGSGTTPLAQPSPYGPSPEGAAGKGKL